MLLDSQNDWLDELKKNDGIDKSFTVRRAIRFYRKYGMEKDKMMKQAMGDEL